MKPKQRRILYVQKYPGGGSMISLYHLIHDLDKSRFTPVILLYSPHYKKEFEKLGAKVVMLCTTSSNPTEIGEAIPSSPAHQPKKRKRFPRPFTDLRRLVRRDWPLAQQIARIIRAEKIDLVHHNNHLISNRDAIIGARLAGVPQIVHVRLVDDYPKGSFSYFFDRILSHCIGRFIYISKSVEQVYLNLGIPKNKGEIIDNPFDLTDYNSIIDVDEVRAEFNLSPDDLVISNVGRLVSRKGQHYFIRAMAQVIQAEPRAKALMVGGVDPIPESHAYSQELQTLVADMNLSEQVLFTGFRSDVARVVAASDIVVLSACEPEGFGRVVVEGMAAGKPVVATDVGGVPEIIESGVTGLLVPPRDIEEMAKAILHLLQNQDVADEIGRRAQQYVRGRFTPEKHITKVHSIYERVLTR